MRILYFLLFVTLRYSLRVFYPRMKRLNSPKGLLGRTIYVSNHPASFMDPLVAAALRRPIVFFMTRSDIFKPHTKPFLWACQMIPIYRQLDGVDTKGKNEEVFKKAANVLSFGRNLLIFGEGFTDDTFIRRLKPVKKGAAKIGFQTLELLEWKKKIYVSAIGINYSYPNRLRSDLLMSTSEKFCLNDYKEMYNENPNKAITVVTRRIEQMIKDQITHVEDKDLAPFHEHLMMLTRKGMNVDCFDPSIPLENRWRYSQNLAKWLNKQNIDTDKQLQKLKEDLESYMKLLKRMRLEESHIYWKKTNPSGSRLNELILMTVLTPFAIIGLIHTFLPYYVTKRFVENSFRRKVFWGSVKLIMGKILMGVVNIPYIFIFYYFIYPNWLLAIGYYFSIGLTGLAAYMWFRYFKRYKVKGKINCVDVSKFIEKREELVIRINELVPDKF